MNQVKTLNKTTMLQNNHNSITILDSVTKELSIESDTRGLLKGYASVFNHVDRDNDSILPDAFNDTIDDFLNRNNVKLLWQHKADHPIGTITNIMSDEYGLFISAQLALNLEQANEVYQMLQANLISGLSVGMIIKEYYIDELTQIRYITKAELLEVSVVTFPANEKATVSSLKNHTLESEIENNEDSDIEQEICQNIDNTISFLSQS